MKPEQKIEIFLSLLAYSGGQWKADEVIRAYNFLQQETKGETFKVVRMPMQQQDTH